MPMIAKRVSIFCFALFFLALYLKAICPPVQALGVLLVICPAGRWLPEGRDK